LCCLVPACTRRGFDTGKGAYIIRSSKGNAARRVNKRTLEAWAEGEHAPLPIFRARLERILRRVEGTAAAAP